MGLLQQQLLFQKSLEEIQVANIPFKNKRIVYDRDSIFKSRVSRAQTQADDFEAPSTID